MTEPTHDQIIAAQLRKMGKPECTCEVSIMFVGSTPRVDREPDFTCPVHYPETRELLRGAL